MREDNEELDIVDKEDEGGDGFSEEDVIFYFCQVVGFDIGYIRYNIGVKQINKDLDFEMWIFVLGFGVFFLDSFN